MQPKSRNPKFLGMSVFEIGVLTALGLILCVVVVVGGFFLFSNRNQPQPIPTAFIVPPTYTPYPTYTPPPTLAPVTINTLEPIVFPTATLVSVPPPSGVVPLGERVIKVNSWSLEILEIHSDLGTDSSRQTVVLLANLTNEGTGTDTFSAMFDVLLMDSQGRTYQEDSTAGFAAMSKYQTEWAASINPSATVYIAIAYDVPVTEKSFTLVRGSLASSWSGNVSFTLP